MGLARPQYIPQILSALRSADLSKYKDSMRPLIERDMEETENLKLQQEQNKLVRKERRKKEREAESNRLFEMKQLKKREKHKGH